MHVQVHVRDILFYTSQHGEWPEEAVQLCEQYQHLWGEELEPWEGNLRAPHTLYRLWIMWPTHTNVHVHMHIVATCSQTQVWSHTLLTHELA